MSEEKETGVLAWIKGGKGILAIIFLLTIIPGFIISIIEESEKKQALQIEASDIYLDYYLNEDTGIISLYLLNRSQIAAHGLNLTIYLPRYFSVKKTGDCKLSIENDSTLIANFSQSTIYNTFSNKIEYPVVDLKLKGVNKKKLEESIESIKYIINCDEGEFKGKIPVFYIFTVR